MDRVHHHGSCKAEYGESVEHPDMFIEEIFGFSGPAYQIQDKGPTHCRSAQNEKEIHKDRIGHILPKTIEAMMKRKTHDFGRLDLNLGQDKECTIEDRKQEYESQYWPSPPGIGIGL